MLGVCIYIYVYTIAVTSWIDLLIIMEWPSLFLIISFILRSILSNGVLLVQLSFDSHLHAIFSSILSLSICMCPYK